jgi:hypothetical protein
LVVLDEGSLHTVQTLVDVAVLIRVTTPSTTENGRPARTVAVRAAQAHRMGIFDRDGTVLDCADEGVRRDPDHSMM